MIEKWNGYTYAILKIDAQGVLNCVLTSEYHLVSFDDRKNNLLKDSRAQFSNFVIVQLYKNEDIKSYGIQSRGKL